MTCDVLAYPSMVLVFLCCLVFLLVRRSEKKWKELCAYVLPCVASAAVMFTYLLSYMTPQKMLEMAGEILGPIRLLWEKNCWDGGQAWERWP